MARASSRPRAGRWEFPHAAVPAGRCPRCAFPPEACLCPEIPRLAVPWRVVILRHASEIPRMTNSGRWAAAALYEGRPAVGFALFGVCLGNILTTFSWWTPELHAPVTSALQLPSDTIAYYLEHAFVDGKFYSIFSLLFGLGF